MSASNLDVTSLLKQKAIKLPSLDGHSAEFSQLINAVGDSQFVLIGEASHGTHEFYSVRAKITKRLIMEKGFTAIALESDFPDACALMKATRDPDSSIAESFQTGYRRFPQFMWANTEVLSFASWLRQHNEHVKQSQALIKRERHLREESGSAQPGDEAPTPSTVGIYGLDLYSMYESIDEVLKFLEEHDRAAADRAREHYSCFDHFDRNPQMYGQLTALGITPSCEDEAVSVLLQMRSRNAALMKEFTAKSSQATTTSGSGGHHSIIAELEENFYAMINSKIVVDAERYYREMMRGRLSSWNIRDASMASTLDSLVAYLSSPAGTAATTGGLDKHASRAKVVIWAHNSHVGDASATSAGDEGEFTLGQLVRKRHSADGVFLIGQTTFTGTVTAASQWGGVAERKTVRPGMAGSVERLFHSTGMQQFWVDLHDPALATALRTPLLERAIGVIYRPKTERQSHYFTTRLSDQFDAVIHIEETRALEPLKRTPVWERGDREASEETFPTGL